MIEYDKRSWVEINLAQIRKNYQIYKEKLFDKQKIMAVIKADAYGHGDIEVARELSKEGVSDFAVSNVDEACKLREAGIQGVILVLGYTPINQIQRLYNNDITQTIVSDEYAKRLADIGVKVKCQFALDTGMNRIGIDADSPEYCIDLIRKYNKKLCLTGIFTHLCIADEQSDDAVSFTRQQIQKFEVIANRLTDLKLQYVHYLNSAGGLWYNTGNSEVVRLGIVLYGLKPDYLNILPDGILPVMEWKSVVSLVKPVYKGETIGYGRVYKAECDMKVATIPTGYADGYNRLLSNRGFVLINGERAPIVGRICMDQFMVDVTEIQNVEMGTEVVLLGRSGKEMFSADDMAQMISSIGYEVICDISKRVPRIYINQ